MSKVQYGVLRQWPMVRVYGAWLFLGEWDGHSLPPQAGWMMIRMEGGTFDDPPEGFNPEPGYVTLLGQGTTVIIVTPEVDK